MAVALLAALVVGVWFLRAVERVEPSSANVPRTDEVIAASEPALALLAAAATSASGASGAVHGADEIEVCGGQWIKTRPDGEIDFDELKRAGRLPEVRARLVGNLRTAPDEYARAVGALVDATGSPDGLLAMLPALAGSGVPPVDFIARRDALVRMALSTSDPKVYALAFNSCGQGESGGACQQLSAEQWARLDPGNAAPWLFELERAGRRRDAMAQAEALHRIATATRSDPYFFSVSAVILEHLPDDEATKIAATMFVTESIGMAAAWSLPGYQPLMNACGKDQLLDSNRRQTCDSAAELLVTRSNTMLEQGIGIALGKRLDWPAERTDRLRGEYVAYQASGLSGPAGASSSACDAITHDLELVRRHVRVGEVGALREWVKQSGKTADDFIRIEREAQATRAAEAASAASAAPPSR